jgi:hypothetical protein
MPTNYTEIVISFAETLSIMLVVLLLNWLSTQIIAPNLAIRKMEKINELAMDSEDYRQQLMGCIQDLKKEKRLLSIIWGPELSCASIGLYFSILGVWTSRGDLFSLSKMLGIGASFEVIIWVLLLIFYLTLMSLSIFYKELYVESTKDPISIGDRYLNISNYLGAFSMFTLIIILKYATSQG